MDEHTDDNQLPEAAPARDVRQTIKGGSGNIQAVNSTVTVTNYATPAPRPEIDPTVAQALLDRMPLDAVPNPAPLPPRSRMPLSRNLLFIGREDDLKALAAALKPRTGAAAITTGIGGVGKTQLAAEFAHRYGQFFAGGVFWLSFADPAGIDAEIAACGGAGALECYTDADGLTLADQVRRVYAVWEQETPRLLIFDNCDGHPSASAAALLMERLPHSGGCRVLVTSRHGHWPGSLGFTAHPIGVLPRANSLALLRGYRADLSDADADAIAAELGDLPLALTLAGSYLETYRDEAFGVPATYLANLRQQLLAHRSLHGAGTPISLTGHELNVSATFDLSYQRLDAADSTDALAIAALARAACLAPGEPFPRDLLVVMLDNESATDEEQAAALRADALRRLIALGLLEIAEVGALRIHRLIAAFVSHRVADANALGAVEQALIATSYDLLSKGLPAAFLPFQSHLRYLIEPALARIDRRASDLSTIMARYLQLVGDYTNALPYAQRALVIDEAAPDADERTIATDLSDVAGLLQAQGDYAAARPLYERALAIREQAQGPEHPETATSLNNLAGLLKAQGDYAAARPLYERALAIREQALGSEHPETATSLNNLALLLQAQGDYAAARPLCERALAICEDQLGPDHPTTEIIRGNLASLNDREVDTA